METSLTFTVAAQRCAFPSLHSLPPPSRKMAVQLNTSSEEANERYERVRAFRPHRATMWAQTHNTERQADGWEEVVAAQRELVITQLPEHHSAVEWNKACEGKMERYGIAKKKEKKMDKTFRLTRAGHCSSLASSRRRATVKDTAI